MKCSTCEGCGRVANTEDQEPWSVWQSMPIASGAAVILGMVRPVICPSCKGTGVEEMA